MRALFDINVLIALLDAEHLHHEAARAWLRSNIEHGWATSPITQNGCLRIMAQPAYPNPLPVARVAERLAEAMATADHEFWPDDASLLGAGVMNWSRVIGPRQITDIYLLAMAAERQGRFVTFDARVSRSAVPRARDEHLCVI